MPNVRIRGLARRPFRVSANQKASFSTVSVVNTDSKISSRYLNAEEGRFFSAPDNYWNLKFTGGVVTAGTASGRVIYIPRDVIVKSVSVTVGGLTANGTTTVDVIKAASPNAAGTSVFGGTPALVAGGSVYATGSVSAGTVTKGSYLRVETTRGGTGTCTDMNVLINADLI